MEKYSFQSKNKEVSIDKVLEELNVTENDILGFLNPFRIF